MSPSRIVQPLVCCLGNPVAGNPTQFVMMRAARAAGVEWRFLTSEVAADRFETAFRGIQALGFDGVSLMPPFQQAVIPLLDSVTGTALALGSVNVARVDGNSWLGDNTLGLGLARCLESQTKSENRIIGNIENSSDGDTIVVSEVSKKNDSDGIALVALAPVLARVLKMTSWRWSQSIQHFGGDVSGSESAIDPMQSDESDEKRLEPIRFLILEKTPPQQYHKPLVGLNWASHSACIVMEPGPDRLTRSFREMLLKNGVDWVSPLALRAHCYAADFQFWTGIEPSIALIEDSLEEYDEW